MISITEEEFDNIQNIMNLLRNEIKEMKKMSYSLLQVVKLEEKQHTTLNLTDSIYIRDMLVNNLRPQIIKLGDEKKEMINNFETFRSTLTEILSNTRIEVVKDIEKMDELKEENEKLRTENMQFRNQLAIQERLQYFKNQTQHNDWSSSENGNTSFQLNHMNMISSSEDEDISSSGGEPDLLIEDDDELDVNKICQHKDVYEQILELRKNLLKLEITIFQDTG